ncbi:JAB domain-containing protein [Tateyamaria sp.]|uniref:JAB domain-containing protein n=1 Tax=Tateyamaria sp. TaxID=1929288 RepID=UPI003B221B69
MSHFAEQSLPFDLDEATPARIRPGKTPSYMADHRKRLRTRFVEGGASAMPDYELLELILFRAIPRQDVKPLAHDLMNAFGDFNRVITAPIDRLRSFKGVGDAVITELKIVEAAAQRLARSKVLNKQLISSWDALIDYCHTTMAHRETEQFRVLFLDRKNVLIADEEQAKGTVDHVPVYPREVAKRALELNASALILVHNHPSGDPTVDHVPVYPREVAKRALELNASALILVHNHPSGDPTPSQSDIDMTAQMEMACAALGLTLHDHLIVGKSRELSFKSEGYL